MSPIPDIYILIDKKRYPIYKSSLLIKVGMNDFRKDIKS